MQPHGTAMPQQTIARTRDGRVSTIASATIPISSSAIQPIHYAVTSPGDLTGLGFTTLTTPNIVIGAQHIFSPTLTNDARFGFNRAAFTQGETGTRLTPS